MKVRATRQPRLPFPRRPRRGRPPTGRAGVPHASRPELDHRHPVHVTLKVVPLPDGLRRDRLRSAIEGALAAGADRFGFRLVHYSVQHDHLHLVAEAEDARALSRGMQGLAIRIARRVNRALGRAGKLFADRFHARILRSPREVRAVLAYCLNNAYKHAGALMGRWRGVGDPFSSGRFFTGWKGVSARFIVPRAIVAEARSWLLRDGWKRHGLIELGEIAVPP